MLRVQHRVASPPATRRCARAAARPRSTILKDRDGYEICFVGEEGFDDLSHTKRGDERIDWGDRAARGGDG